MPPIKTNPVGMISSFFRISAVSLAVLPAALDDYDEVADGLG
jgi:hypothetical protein